MSQPDTDPRHYHVSYEEPQGVAKQMDKRCAGRLKAQPLKTRYPLFIARYPELPDEAPSYHSDQDNSDSSPFGPSLDGTFEDLDVPSPSSSTQLDPAERLTEFWFEEYQADLMKRSQARFDPRLLTLTSNSDYSQGFTSNRQAAIDWVASGPAALLGCLASLPTASNGYFGDKRSFIQKFVVFTDLLGSRMYGDATFRFSHNDSTFLQPNSALTFAAGHGGERSRNEPLLKPDLVIVESAKTGGAVQHWHQIQCAAGVSVMLSADFSAGDLDQQKNIVSRILAYKEVFSRNHPFSGRSFTFTLAGTALRIWKTDAFSFASSAPAWLDDYATRAERIVDTIGFLLAPSTMHYESRPPPLTNLELHCMRGNVRASNCDTEEGEEKSDWRWVQERWDWELESESESKGGLPVFRYAEIRKCLFGYRTLVILGNTRIAQGEGPFRNAFLKGVFLPKGLAYHECRILTILHDDESPGSDILDLNKPTASTISPFIVGCLPKAVGMLSEYITDPWETEHVGTASVDHLRYQALMTLGPIGKRVPTGFSHKAADNLAGLRDYGRILKGVFESLWYTSSKGIHYRDLNLGNIMWTRDESGQVVGYIIDFGNSRYLQQLRQSSLIKDQDDMVMLCEDDARSATPWFQSIWSMQCEACGKALSTAITELKNLSENAMPEMRVALAQDVEQARVTAQLAEHRYIDDLESTLYVILWHLGWRCALRSSSTQAPLLAITKFETKRPSWDGDLIKIAYGYTWSGVWSKMIVDLVKTIRTSREALFKGLANEEHPPSTLSQIENDCFATCVATIDQALCDLPDDGFE